MKFHLPVLFLVLAALAADDAHADPRAEVQAALGRIVDAGGFHARVEGHVFGPDVPAVSGEIDVIFPDRLHVRGEDLEFIVLPSGAWVSALGLWAPTDPDLLPVTTFEPAAMREAIASIRDVRDEGRANAHQCAARAYRFHASGQLPGADADGEVRLWVCAKDGRTARIEGSGEGGRRVIVDFDWSRKPQVRAP